MDKPQEENGVSNEEQDETDAVSEDNVLEEHIIDVSVYCSLVVYPEHWTSAQKFLGESGGMHPWNFRYFLTYILKHSELV